MEEGFIALHIKKTFERELSERNFYFEAAL